MLDLRLIEWMLADPLGTNFEISGPNSLLTQERALQESKQELYNAILSNGTSPKRKNVQKVENKPCRQLQHSLTL